jgi:hypothetical protein
MLKKITIKKLHDSDDTGYVDATMASRILMTWELTKSVWVFVKDYDAQQRLQRDVTTFSKRKS